MCENKIFCKCLNVYYGVSTYCLTLKGLINYFVFTLAGVWPQTCSQKNQDTAQRASWKFYPDLRFLARLNSYQ